MSNNTRKLMRFFLLVNFVIWPYGHTVKYTLDFFWTLLFYIKYIAILGLVWFLQVVCVLLATSKLLGLERETSGFEMPIVCSHDGVHPTLCHIRSQM